MAQKVLIVCDSSKSLIDFRGKLIEAMVKQNDVYVFTPRVRHQYVRDVLNDLKVTVFENDLDGSNVSIKSDVRYIFQLYKLIKKIQPDVFFPYTFKPVIYGTALAKLCNIKLITPMLTGLGYTFTNNQKKRLVTRLTHSLLKLSLKNNKQLKVIFQNKDDHQTLLQHNILTTGHRAYVVNGSGVDLDYYQYSRPDTQHISFLMLARLINAKGIQEYFDAAQYIRQQFPHVKFKLIGAYGPNVDKISDELYQKIKQGDIVEYIGEVEDVRPYIQSAAVVVLPSYYGEGVPRCLLESMAMGRAIITTDSVGCRETIDSTEDANGFLIPTKNSSALAAKMEFYLKNTNTIISYGLNSLAYARKKFNVHLINADMLNIMQLN